MRNQLEEDLSHICGKTTKQIDDDANWHLRRIIFIRSDKAAQKTEPFGNLTINVLIIGLLYITVYIIYKTL